MTQKRTWRTLKKGDPVWLPRDEAEDLEEVVGTFDSREGNTVYVWLTDEDDITEIPDVDLDEEVEAEPR